MARSWSCTTILLLPMIVTLSLPGYTTAAAEEPCPVPAVCLEGSNGCGTDDGSGHVTVNCSYREIPFVPVFPDYPITLKSWAFDFSNNRFATLDGFSFIPTSHQLPMMNLTSLDLSHNYIFYIKVKTFSAISENLARLILSYNRLTILEAGTFDNLPAMHTLDLSYNSIVSIDLLCDTSFPMLTYLNVGYNSISNVALGCLSGAQKNVILTLDNNCMGSVDDCSYSSQVTVSLQNNPILCGCSEIHFDERCLEINTDSNTTSPSRQPKCNSSALSAACLNVTFDLSYQSATTDMDKKYNILVTFANDAKHKVELLEYIDLRSDSVSAKLLQSNSATVSEFSNDSPLPTSGNYSVCVTLHSDRAAKQRKCQFLSPPSFPPSKTTSPSNTVAPTNTAAASKTAALLTLLPLLAASSSY